MSCDVMSCDELSCAAMSCYVISGDYDELLMSCDKP